MQHSWAEKGNPYNNTGIGRSWQTKTAAGLAYKQYPNFTRQQAFSHQAGHNWPAISIFKIYWDVLLEDNAALLWRVVHIKVVFKITV